MPRKGLLEGLTVILWRFYGDINPMTPDKAVTKSLVLESRLAEMRKTCRRILAEVRDIGYSCDDIFAIHLAVEEALVNAVKHGNRKDPKKSVSVEYSAGPEKFEISVADQGSGFSPKDIPDPRDEKNLYNASGRGVLLMQSYMDIVEYNESGNRVHMIKYRTK
jgi:serine/threonine-protein kinase RsbW